MQEFFAILIGPKELDDLAGYIYNDENTKSINYLCDMSQRRTGTALLESCIETIIWSAKLPNTKLGSHKHFIFFAYPLGDQRKEQNFTD